LAAIASAPTTTQKSSPANRRPVTRAEIRLSRRGPHRIRSTCSSVTPVALPSGTKSACADRQFGDAYSLDWSLQKANSLRKAGPRRIGSEAWRARRNARGKIPKGRPHANSIGNRTERRRCSSIASERTDAFGKVKVLNGDARQESGRQARSTGDQRSRAKRPTIIAAIRTRMASISICSNSNCALCTQCAQTLSRIRTAPRCNAKTFEGPGLALAQVRDSPMRATAMTLICLDPLCNAFFCNSTCGSRAGPDRESNRPVVFLDSARAPFASNKNVRI
jgi:hypothetical protein